MISSGSRNDATSFHLHDALPEDAILIIGAGHFGKRAARILSQIRHAQTPVLIIDKDKGKLSGIKDLPVESILCDGIDFLVENFRSLNPSNTIIPAIPFHLAFEWLKRYFDNGLSIKKIAEPKGIKSFLPHTWKGSEGSLLVSYADFRCPDDCPEPEDYCTLTGEKREKPLYELLRQLMIPCFGVHIIRSHQLAPGLGGYKSDELNKLAVSITEGGAGKWLVGTACRCHGTITAMEML